MEVMLGSSESLLLNKISHRYSKRQAFSLSCCLLHLIALMCFLEYNHLHKLLSLFNQPECKTGLLESINWHPLISEKGAVGQAEVVLN